MARDLPKRMHFKHGRYYYVHSSCKIGSMSLWQKVN
jgi:hypothetical protein